VTVTALALAATALALAPPAAPPAPAPGSASVSVSSGPPKGALVIGGGDDVPASTARFVELAGGPGASFVFIPTAAETDDAIPRAAERWKARFKVKDVTVLHTRDRARADSDDFVEPLRRADAVWFGGGRQWRLVDAYANTRTQRELEGVLKRGGVIGGSSAGATIQGSYLVRGAREGNHIMMARGYEEGFGYVKNVAIDQHLLTRHREDDLVPVIDAHPGLLGIGLDDPTAVVVRGDTFEVIGRGRVGVYDGKDHDGKTYYFLAVGDRFDLKTRTPLGGKGR
jgi:cyanophycinase